ncbi:MAG: dihydrodipicolinate synthase family protein [Actinomycetia bacterium]|nr:dihydrodipicolinate synthase family protein [Actinomycetes bacterium]
MDLRGLVPVVVTPFGDDGGIVWEDLEREIQFLLDAGAAGIAFGFASEVEALDAAERRRLVALAKGLAGGRVAVVFGARGLEAAERAALAAWVDVWMISPPAGLPPAVLADWARGYAEGPGLLFQDAPAFTGVDLAPDQILALADAVPLVGVKAEAPPTPRRVSALRAGRPRLCILGGLHGTWLPEELAAGADGTMPAAGWADLFGRYLAQYAAAAGALPRETFWPLADLNRFATATFAFSLACQREVLRHRGVFRHPVRGRLADETLTASERDTLLALFERAAAR